MDITGRPVYRLDDFEIDVTRGLVTCNGREVRFRPQTFNVLVFLIQRRHRLVTKDELLDAFWKDTPVTEDALIQCIVDLRKTLGDDSHRPHYIKTIPKLRYRFIGEVEESVIKDDPAHTSRTEVEDTVSVKYEYIGKEIPPLHLLPHVQNLAMISSPAQRAVKASPVRRLGGRGPWIAVLAGLLLSAAGFGIWVFLKPGRPLSTFIRGSTVEARDQNGRVCWKKDLPFLSPKARWESGEMQQDLSLIEDIDEDGQIEVLINFVPEERSAARARLICYAENGRLRWEYPLGRALSYQGRSFDERYIGRMIRLVRHPQQSYLEVVSAHELWYPTQVALLEPSSGKLIDEYWHPGSLRHCVLQDLDKDGLQELLLAGLNNPGLGLGHAAFLVLKVPFSSAPRKDEGPFAVFTGG